MQPFKLDLTEEETVIKEAILAARSVQEWIWGDEALDQAQGYIKVWIKCFQKRVDKIKQIDTSHPHAHVELRKRVLQQAALSVYLMRLLDFEQSSIRSLVRDDSKQLERQQSINFIT